MGEEIEKFKKHCGKGEEVELDGDKFLLKPLPSKYLPYFLEIQQHLLEKKEEIKGNPEKAFVNAPKEVIKHLVYLTEETVKLSYPELPKEIMTQFVSKNFDVLLTAVIRINLGAESEVQKQTD